MLKIPGTPPVRTRLPLAAWAVAAVVTLFSLVSSLLHAHQPLGHAMPSADESPPAHMPHQAKV